MECCRPTTSANLNNNNYKISCHLIQQHPVTAAKINFNNDVTKIAISILTDCAKKIVIFNFDFKIVTAVLCDLIILHHFILASVFSNVNSNNNKKAVLPQGNRAMPQVFFSVEVRQQHSLQV